jgi:hypothetical protein
MMPSAIFPTVACLDELSMSAEYSHEITVERVEEVAEAVVFTAPPSPSNTRLSGTVIRLRSRPSMRAAATRRQNPA